MLTSETNDQDIGGLQPGSMWASAEHDTDTSPPTHRNAPLVCLSGTHCGMANTGVGLNLGSLPKQVSFHFRMAKVHTSLGV